MTTIPAQPAADTTKQGVVAGAIAFGCHLVVLGAAVLASRLVEPSGGGFQDLAAFVVTFFGGELLLALASLIVGTVLFKRGRQRTGVGLMGGWLAGMVVVVMLQAIT